MVKIDFCKACLNQDTDEVRDEEVRDPKINELNWEYLGGILQQYECLIIFNSVFQISKHIAKIHDTRTICVYMWT